MFYFYSKVRWADIEQAREDENQNANDSIIGKKVNN